MRIIKAQINRCANYVFIGETSSLLYLPWQVWETGFPKRPLHQSSFSKQDYQRQPELQLSVTPHNHTGSLWDLKEPERSDFTQNQAQRSIQKTESVWEEEREYWIVEILLQTLNNLFEMNTHTTLAHTCLFCCQFLYLPVSCCHKLKAEVCKDDFLCLISAFKNHYFQSGHL